MRRWDLDTSAAHLRDAKDDLQIAWQQTEQLWQDAVSQNFCESELEPIGPAIKLTIDAVARMQQLLNQMQRDCEQ
ncbi:MAG: hypothetical protein MK171_11270 [Pirellulales bacterium]|nr:hypothetical protein [Pirellulales bacterium]